MISIIFIMFTPCAYTFFASDNANLLKLVFRIRNLKICLSFLTTRIILLEKLLPTNYFIYLII